MWEEWRIRIWELPKGRLVGGLLMVVLAAGVWYGSAVAGRHRPVTSAHTAPAARSTPEVEAIRSRVAAAAEQGDWRAVDSLILDTRSRGRKEPGLAPLVEELTVPLQVESDVHFSLPRGAAQAGAELPVLTEGDEYWLHLQLPVAAYLYVVEQSPEGRFVLLFPNARYSSLENPVDQDLHLPENFSTPFAAAPGGAGVHTLYVLASRWPQTLLEKLLASAGPTGAAEAAKLLEGALAHTATIPGLTCGKRQFRQVEARGTAPAQAEGGRS